MYIFIFIWRKIGSGGGKSYLKGWAIGLTKNKKGIKKWLNSIFVFSKSKKYYKNGTGGIKM